MLQAASILHASHLKSNNILHWFIYSYISWTRLTALSNNGTTFSKTQSYLLEVRDASRIRQTGQYLDAGINLIYVQPFCEDTAR